MKSTIVRYRNQFGCIETYIAKAGLTRCEIRWLLPHCEIVAMFCWLPQKDCPTNNRKDLSQ